MPLVQPNVSSKVASSLSVLGVQGRVQALVSSMRATDDLPTRIRNVTWSARGFEATGPPHDHHGECGHIRNVVVTGGALSLT